MDKAIFGFFALIVLVGVGYFGFTKYQKSQGGSAPMAAAPVAPPPDAQFVPDDVGAEGVMASVASARKAADQKEAEASWVGVWVPDSGWTGEVKDITQERGQTAVRMSLSSSRIMGGSFFVIAVLNENDKGVVKGDGAVVQGRISRVEVLPGGPIPTFRIVLEPAKVLEIQRR